MKAKKPKIKSVKPKNLRIEPIQPKTRAEAIDTIFASMGELGYALGDPQYADYLVFTIVGKMICEQKGVKYLELYIQEILEWDRENKIEEQAKLPNGTRLLPATDKK